ncbi:MAG TPA: transposase [Acidobacteriota bacterium]|nr:transposase [Acidobacteriota bacterium]
MKETVRLYIQSKSSSREVAATMKIDQSTVIRWTQQLGEKCADTIQTNRQLRPQWRGWLGIDGKFIRVGGHHMACLLAIDLATLDIPHCDLVTAEDEAGCRRFLEIVRQQVGAGRGIVSDLGKGKVWLKLIAELFPDVPHQACIVHFDRYVQQTLPKSKNNRHAAEHELLRQLIKRLLYAQTFADAEEVFVRLLDCQSYFQVACQRTILTSLKRHFDLLTAHFHTPGLDRTNNVTENLIKQLDRKIFLLNDFSTPQAALNFLKLWVLNYRFKPFSASSIETRNGRSPLALAGVETNHWDWLDFGISPNN